MHSPCRLLKSWDRLTQLTIGPNLTSSLCRFFNSLASSFSLFFCSLFFSLNRRMVPCFTRVMISVTLPFVSFPELRISSQFLSPRRRNFSRNSSCPLEAGRLRHGALRATRCLG